MKSTDISYLNQGMFTSFLPDSSTGETAIREMMEQNGGSNKVLSVHADAVIAQLRKAGYTVRKAKPVTGKDMDAICAELDELGL